MLARITRYLTTDIWRVPLAGFSRRKAVLIRYLRVIILAVRGFSEDKCFLQASALTFYFLLSVVPVLAMVLGIARGFGLETILEARIMETFQEQQEIAATLIQFAHSMLEQLKGGVIAGIGLVLLLWTVIRVLSNIEKSFNEIWGIKKSRSPGRKFSDYFAIVFVSPILLVFLGSMTMVAMNRLQVATEHIPVLSLFAPSVFLLDRLLPYLLVWAAFSFIYSFMPNTKVNFKAALLGGVVGGTVYHVIQWAYISFQVGAARYGAVSGGFAAIPLFLVWVQVSWLVLLFGAEISFAQQNVETYEYEHDCLEASYSLKKLICLRIVHLLVRRFVVGEPALTAQQVSWRLEVPIRLVNEILYELVKSGFVCEARPEDARKTFYQPACDPELLTVKSVIDTLEQYGSHGIPVVRSEELTRISECLEEFGRITRESPANMLLKNI